ncbi:Beta-1-4-N-acetylgalactosaminyltransferase bre-4 [Brachionus plicatilis]|uniref:Beta-1,4-galactosyltransferase n=1 Tax=Brachionus plicatilis TaxID=10195 RepID=A0A3M7RW63_BRAPC|nr:Beta-1-4-N-acetylgalactosaminyltransferase bre-4 [Brachionus plicatilis]
MRFSKIQNLIIINLAILLVVFTFHEKILTSLDSYNTAIFCNLKSNQNSKCVNKKSKNESGNFDKIARDLRHLNLKPGGQNILKRYKSKIAIVVPYRDRIRNLKIFLRYVHPFLVQQNIYYGFFLIEPIGNLTFNKGIAMNAGFVESQKENDWDCFIFHDVDLLPESIHNIYSCDQRVPKLLSTSISSFGYSVDGYFKEKHFGGVTAFTREQFETINGFSNVYFGWGLEDDDARLRVLAKYPSVRRVDPENGRYYANCHKQQKRNPNRFIQYLNSRNRQTKDGLNSLDYKIIKWEKSNLFIRIFISYHEN